MLVVEQKTLFELFGNNKTDFLIPDYQRPYAWGLEECQTLWNDLVLFAIPDNNYEKFNAKTDVFFLGPIVWFVNKEGKQEIIDGQQRLTTLMLLFRVFLKRIGGMQDERSKKIRMELANCIWKSNEYGEPDDNALKIESLVATDDAKTEFLTILKTGQVYDEQESAYAKNFRYFEIQLEAFLKEFPDYFQPLANRVLKNCILMPIEADSQDNALRIFSTLNDRGKPLADADIFKAKLYHFYSDKNERESFIQRWRDLESLCGKLFRPGAGTPMDDLFTRYMYFERAKQGNKSSTTEALRKFYERDSYALLQKNQTFDNLEKLAKFWEDVENQNTDYFSERVLRRLFVLHYAPNGMWAYIVSVYFLHNSDNEGNLEEEPFFRFLNCITAFIWAYAVMNPGVNALRTPVYAEMVNIVNGGVVTFSDYSFEESQILTQFRNYEFSNNRPITKAMLTWYAFQNPEQPLPQLTDAFDIEHIYAKKRLEIERGLTVPAHIEWLGNKSLLERRINIRAAEYHFADKIPYYRGYINSRNKHIKGTKIQELLLLANKTDFTEDDIIERTEKILKAFVQYLADNRLLK